MQVTGVAPIGWEMTVHHTCVASFTCTVNFQLPCFEEVCTDSFVGLLCCWFIFHLNSAFCHDGQAHLKRSASRLKISLQTAHCGDRVVFGRCGRCGHRNALSDTELVWVVKAVEG